MIEIKEAIQLISVQSIKTSISNIPLNKAIGKTLATDVMSKINMPPFRQAAVDGYAIAEKDHHNYSIIGEIPAGSGSVFSINKNNACRIFTGARVPDDANFVVMQEWVSVREQSIEIVFDKAITQQMNIRPEGEQIKKGEVALKKGQYLNPAALGYLAGLGIEKIDVYNHPRTGLIVTGSELVRPGQDLIPGQIYESNGLMLETALSQEECPPVYKLNIDDSYEATLEAIQTGLNTCDILFISGGISVGDYDFVRQALLNSGVEQIFYKVNQKPGKPLFFGRKDNRFVFALPGNPAAALSCYYLYGRLLINRFKGKTSHYEYQLPLAMDYKRKSDRLEFLKARCTPEGVEILNQQSSAMLGSFATADHLALAEKLSYKKGDKISCFKLFG